MIIPSTRPNALAWHLALIAAGLQLLGNTLVQAYLLTASPMAGLLRQTYARPDMAATTVVQIVAGSLLIGLVTWCTMQGWLRRHGAGGVDRPRRLVAVLLAMSLVLFVLVSAGQALLHHGFYSLVTDHKEWLDNAFGRSGPARMLLMVLPVKVCALLLAILGGWLAVRIAAWSVTPDAGALPPPYRPRHAAWIAALTLLLWQLQVGLIVGAYFMAYASSQQWLDYALGYWVLPALVLALAAWTCLKSLPGHLGPAGFGRAFAHGTFAFWLTQALGVGLALLVLNAMSWRQIMRAAQMQTTTVLSLLIYGVLLALACRVGARLFYRRAEPPRANPA